MRARQALGGCRFGPEKRDAPRCCGCCSCVADLFPARTTHFFVTGSTVATASVLPAHEFAVRGIPDIGMSAQGGIAPLDGAAALLGEGLETVAGVLGTRIRSAAQLAFLCGRVVAITLAAALAGTQPFAVIPAADKGVVVEGACWRRSRRHRWGAAVAAGSGAILGASQPGERAIGKSRQMILERRPAADRLALHNALGRGALIDGGGSPGRRQRSRRRPAPASTRRRRRETT